MDGAPFPLRSGEILACIRCARWRTLL
jgi:hypothetical protein